jgi:iron complex outermembrane receptor protein
MEAAARDIPDGDLSATAPPKTGSAGGRVSRARTGFLTWVNETNLLSTGSGPLQWVVGAFAMRDDVPLNFYSDSAHNMDFVSPTNIIALSITHSVTRLAGILFGHGVETG